MKLPSLISDRKLILLLIQYGLCGYIAVFFIPAYENTAIVLLCGILIPFVIMTPLVKSKMYQKLKFSDEKYPERNESNINLLISFLFPIVYIVFIALFYWIKEDFNVELDQNIYFSCLATFYFMAVFFVFLRKLTYEKKE